LEKFLLLPPPPHPFLGEILTDVKGGREIWVENLEIKRMKGERKRKGK
jgi:hypothetical protein